MADGPRTRDGAPAGGRSTPQQPKRRKESEAVVSLEVDAPNVMEWLNANSDALQDCNPRRTDSLDERIDRSLEFLSRLDAAGLTGWGWPTESGGRGGSTE